MSSGLFPSAELLAEKRKVFRLEQYLSKSLQLQITKTGASLDRNARFLYLCDKIQRYFQETFETEQSDNDKNTSKLLERQKNAIIGYVNEVNFFKDKIGEYLTKNHLRDEAFPSWYPNLVDAVFQENWGLAGIAPWMHMSESSSAKIVGDRIYFLIDGKMVQQKQSISFERFDQLRQALLLDTPKKRLDEDYSEVYMLSGERITIFTGDRVVRGQSSMIFRKYVVKVLTFEEQAERKTIPFEMIKLLKSMVRMGVRVVFAGPMRSGKTTFLMTYQSYEDPALEGVLIQTDPEIRIHEVMPTAPILSIIADGDDMARVTKDIRRSDANYIVVAEGRDAHAFNLIVDVANQGVRRNKTTMHLSQPEDFCYDVANKIITEFGGKLDYQIAKVAKSFDYIFELVELPDDRSQKRLKSVFQIEYDFSTHTISYHKICSFDKVSDSWTFHHYIGKTVREIGQYEDEDAMHSFDTELKRLATLFPYTGDSTMIPIYGKLGG